MNIFPEKSYLYFLNVITSSVIAVLIFGTLWFVFLPFKRVSDFCMCFGIRMLLKTQFWMKSKILFVTPKNTKTVFLSNHRSVLDTFILLASIPSLKVLAKKKLFKIPFLGQIMSISKHIPIDLSNVDSIKFAMEKILLNISQAHPVLIYPELTRCTEGYKGISKFAHFPFDILFEKKISVTPIILKGTDLVCPKKNFCLRRDGKIKLKYLESIHPDHFMTSEKFRRYVWEQMSKAYNDH